MKKNIVELSKEKENMYYRDYLVSYKWYRNGEQFVIDCDGCKMGFDTMNEVKGFIDGLYGY